MKVHIWIDKNDVSKLANKRTDIDFWYRKPSFPNKKNRETVMISISTDVFQALLDNEAIDEVQDDPFLEAFKQMDKVGAARVRVIPAVGAEKFAEYFYNKLNDWVKEDTNNRCKIISVEVREHEKNSAIYYGE